MDGWCWLTTLSEVVERSRLTITDTRDSSTNNNPRRFGYVLGFVFFNCYVLTKVVKELYSDENPLSMWETRSSSGIYMPIWVSWCEIDLALLKKTFFESKLFLEIL